MEKLLDLVLQSQQSHLSQRQVQEAICHARNIQHLSQFEFAPTRVIVAAAGRGSRFQNPEPKVLARGAYGRPLLLRVLDTVAPFDPYPVVVVNPETGPFIQSRVAQDKTHAPCWQFQTRQGGTGDAVLTAETTLAHFSGSLIVVWGDMGALSERLVFAALALQQLLNATITLPTKWCLRPYVALIRSRRGTVIDALQERNGHRMPNEGEHDCGVFIVKCPDVFHWLHNTSLNQQNYSSTDERDFLSLLQPPHNRDKHIYAICMGTQWESQGVNTWQELGIAERATRKIDQQTIEELAHCQTASELLDIVTWSTITANCWKQIEKACLRLALDQRHFLHALPSSKRRVVEKLFATAMKGA
jgi:bifunctional N-acetylglucosamine-1-phosphate-uridyltransferase/glucosamine-1-phosphate-acetyltransferase GlmU-like protein